MEQITSFNLINPQFILLRFEGIAERFQTSTMQGWKLNKYMSCMHEVICELYTERTEFVTILQQIMSLTAKIYISNAAGQ